MDEKRTRRAGWRLSTPFVRYLCVFNDDARDRLCRWMDGWMDATPKKNPETAYYQPLYPDLSIKIEIPWFTLTGHEPSMYPPSSKKKICSLSRASSSIGGGVAFLTVYTYKIHTGGHERCIDRVIIRAFVACTHAFGRERRRRA